MQLKCKKCGNAMEPPETGRPPTYCSKACRRAAEYEITRLNRHLERLETERIRLNGADHMGGRDGAGRTHGQRMAPTANRT